MGLRARSGQFGRQNGWCPRSRSPAGSRERGCQRQFRDLPTLPLAIQHFAAIANGNFTDCPLLPLATRVDPPLLAAGKSGIVSTCGAGQPGSIAPQDIRFNLNGAEKAGGVGSPTLPNAVGS